MKLLATHRHHEFRCDQNCRVLVPAPLGAVLYDFGDPCHKSKEDYGWLKAATAGRP